MAALFCFLKEYLEVRTLHLARQGWCQSTPSFLQTKVCTPGLQIGLSDCGIQSARRLVR